MSRNIFIPNKGNNVNLRDLIGSDSVNDATTSLPQWLTVQDARQEKRGGGKYQRGGACEPLGPALQDLLKAQQEKESKGKGKATTEALTADLSGSTSTPVQSGVPVQTPKTEGKEEVKKTGGYLSATSSFVGQPTVESATSPLTLKGGCGPIANLSTPSSTTPMMASSSDNLVGGKMACGMPGKAQCGGPDQALKELDTVTSLTNTSALEDKLKALFDEAQAGGKRRRKSKKSKKATGGKRKSKKSKQSGGKKKSKKSKQSGGKKKSKKSKQLKRTEEAPAGEKKAKRKINPAFQAHLDFVKHIQKALGLKGGPNLQKLGKYYKDLAKEKNPSITDAVQMAKKAIEVFDQDMKAGKAKQKWDEISK